MSNVETRPLFLWRASDQKVFVADIAKAKNLIGWQPKVSLEEGIVKTYQWYVGK